MRRPSRLKLLRRRRERRSGRLSARSGDGMGVTEGMEEGGRWGAIEIADRRVRRREAGREEEERS